MLAQASGAVAPWLRRKLAALRFDPRARSAARAPLDAKHLPFPIESVPLFENPFCLDDIAVFDDATLRALVNGTAPVASIDDLTACAPLMSPELRRRVRSALTPRQRLQLDRKQRKRRSRAARSAAERRLLDALFWELTYWKTPELYEELTEGERLHPGIFARLAPLLAGAAVLDAGAGSGRATFECLKRGAVRVHAVEPSGGLLRLLERKAHDRAGARRIDPIRGRFDAVPLKAASVDLAIACSAFTAEDGQGGDRGLRELQRVTRSGGRIVIIWPRVEDHGWFASRGFHYEALPVEREMLVRFRSLSSAVRCAQRFYGRRRAVLRYLARHRRPEVPFSVLGLNQPHDYCWMEVTS